MTTPFAPQPPDAVPVNPEPLTSAQELAGVPLGRWVMKDVVSLHLSKHRLSRAEHKLHKAQDELQLLDDDLDMLKHDRFQAAGDMMPPPLKPIVERSGKEGDNDREVILRDDDGYIVTTGGKATVVGTEEDPAVFKPLKTLPNHVQPLPNHRVPTSPGNRPEFAHPLTKPWSKTPDGRTIAARPRNAAQAAASIRPSRLMNRRLRAVGPLHGLEESLGHVVADKKAVKKLIKEGRYSPQERKDLRKAAKLFAQNKRVVDRIDRKLGREEIAVVRRNQRIDAVRNPEEKPHTKLKATGRLETGTVKKANKTSDKAGRLAREVLGLQDDYGRLRTEQINRRLANTPEGRQTLKEYYDQVRSATASSQAPPPPTSPTDMNFEQFDTYL